MKKQRLLATVLTILLVAMIPLVSGCTATTNQVSATIWSTGTDNYSDTARAADEAIAALSKSSNIKVPSTLEGGKLKIASDAAYPPLEYLAKISTQEGDKAQQITALAGFEVDLYTAVAKKLGLEPVYEQVGFSRLTSVLAEGTVDMVASGLVTSPELLVQYVASDTYLSADLAICTASATSLPDETALQGKTVGFQAGSAAESLVGGITGVGEARPYSHIVSAFADLSEGKVDAVVVEEPVAEWVLATNPGYATALTISGLIETGQGYAFWCNKKDQALIDAINMALEELQQAPVLEQETTTTSEGVNTEGTTTTSVSATTTTELPADASKSVYQLLLEKWGLTSE